MGLEDLTVLVLEVVGAGAVEDAGNAPGDGGAVAARLQPVATGLHPDEPGVGVDEAGEGAHGVAAAADAGHDVLRVGSVEDLPALGPGFVAHDPLELPHHPRIGVGADDGPDAVVRVLHRGHPVPQRLVDGVLQGGAAGLTGTTSAPRSRMRKTLRAWRSTSTAPMNTLHRKPNRAAAVAVATPCWPAPVSAMTGRLAHVAGQQRLAQHVVDLVGAGVGQVLPLQQHPHAEALRQAVALGYRCRPAGVAGEQRRELGPEVVRRPGLAEGGLQIHQRRDEGLGDEAAAELAEAAPVGRLGARGPQNDGRPPRRCRLRRRHVPSSAQS